MSIKRAIFGLVVSLGMIYACGLARADITQNVILMSNDRYYLPAGGGWTENPDVPEISISGDTVYVGMLPVDKDEV